MSNIQEELKSYLENKGLTIDILSELPREEWESLPGPDGNPLSLFQKVMISGMVNQYRKSKSKSIINTKNSYTSNIESKTFINKKLLKNSTFYSTGSLKTPKFSEDPIKLPNTEEEKLQPSEGGRISDIFSLTSQKVLSAFKEIQLKVKEVIDKPKSGTQIELEKLKEEKQKLEAENKRLQIAAENKTSAIAERDRLRAQKVKSKNRIDDLLSKTYEETRIALKDVQKMVSDLSRLGTNLDICFCIDATSSMCGLIQSVKNCIINVSQNISSKTGMSVRFALVVYRDYCDGALRHQIWDFTTSANLSAYLGTVCATGGGDVPEDCFGGLNAACSKINWKAPSRIIIWMGDSPQHGLKYSGGGDSYPAGDPDGITSDIIFEKLRTNKILLVFCRLCSMTDQMMAQLRVEVENYGDGVLLEYNLEGDEINSFLVSTITAVTSRTLSFSGRGGKEKTYSLTPANWDIGSGLWRTEEDCEIFTFQAYYGRDIHPLIDMILDGPDTMKRKAKIFVTIQPVAKGEMRLAYYSKIKEEKKSWLSSEVQKKGIVKESKYEGDFNKRKYLVDQAKIQSISLFLANVFNDKLLKLGINQRKIMYVPVELLHIPSRTTGNKFFSLEPYIEGRYYKFNNNSGFVEKELENAHPLLQTFSHFTYSYSGGLVTVTDIQGVITRDYYKLTDPVIHTANPSKQLPDPTNLGPKGIAAFFSSHKCNEFCRKMELKTPENLEVSDLETTSEKDLFVIKEEDVWECA